MRVVSLVPSVTDTMATLGVADRLVGVTRYCVAGAPPTARLVGGTKNPAVSEIIDLRPDLVIANTEENRGEDLDRLRAAGVEVAETFVRTVSDAYHLVGWLGDTFDADAGAALEAFEAAQADATRRRPATPVAALTLIWRRPWMAVGPDTYVDDLLTTCGFANVLAGWDDRYPKLDPALVLRPAVVLLPSEPFHFTDDDVPAVVELVGGVTTRLVDGELLTWHGTRTPTALRTFSALAAEVAGERPG